MKTLSLNFDELKNEFTVLDQFQLNSIKGGDNYQGEDDDDDDWMCE